MLGLLEKIFDKFSEMRDKEVEEMREKHRAQREKRYEKHKKEEAGIIKQQLKEQSEKQKQLRRTFTTVKEYAEIVKGAKWERLPNDEKEIVIRRMLDLRKKDPQFSKDYSEWQQKVSAENKRKRQQSNLVVSQSKKHVISV